MSREIMKEIYRHNLCSVYLLPLLEINMFNFGENNFVDCFVAPGGDFLYVEVKALDETEDPYHNEYFERTFSNENRHFIVFRLPKLWTHTFLMYREGKYSSFTERAKATIIRHSGLNWKMPVSRRNTTLSDARLLAMYKGEALRRLLAQELEVDEELLQDAELVAPPKEREFLEI